MDPPPQATKTSRVRVAGYILCGYRVPEFTTGYTAVKSMQIDEHNKLKGVLNPTRPKNVVPAIRDYPGGTCYNPQDLVH